MAPVRQSAVSHATGPVPHVKEPHLAGRWYPAAPDVLVASVRAMLGDGAPRPRVVAIVVPHAAYEYSGATAARAFAAAGPGWRRAVVVGPSHFAAFRGAAVLPMTAYRTPLGLLELDQAALDALTRCALVRANPAVFLREHAVEVQLPWLQVMSPGITLVPMLVGRLDAGDGETLAAALRPLMEPGTLVVVSSDLVHYGRRFDYLPVPPADPATVARAVTQLDGDALDHVAACDADGLARYVERTGATICGRSPLDVLLRALPPGTGGEVLAHATSLDAGDDHEHVVGYGAVAFTAAA